MMKKHLLSMASICVFAMTFSTFAQPKPGKPMSAPKPAVKTHHQSQPTPGKPVAAPKPATPQPVAKPQPVATPKPVAQPQPTTGPNHQKFIVPQPQSHQTTGPNHQKFVVPPTQPKPAAPGVKPAPGAPGQPHNGPLPHDYRRGFKAHRLPRPYHRQYYRDWFSPRYDQLFLVNDVPENMQIVLRPGEKFVIKLDEDRKAGFKWFARYDATYVDVDVDHEKANWSIWGTRPRYAEIKIKGRNRGESFVELIYGNREGWENGDAPLKTSLIYVVTE